jgi:hypothetical protein
VCSSDLYRRFTFEWSHYAFFASPAQEALTFQVKLSETTGVIEVHFCELAYDATGRSAERAMGSSATIGVEGLSGSEGVLAGFNVPSQLVASGRGFRFTP